MGGNKNIKTLNDVNSKRPNGKIANGEITSGEKSEGYRLFAKTYVAATARFLRIRNCFKEFCLQAIAIPS